MACVQVRGQLQNIGCLLLPCRSWELNLDPQAWGKHLHLLSHLPSTYVIFDVTSRTAKARDSMHNKFCVKANKASDDRS